MKHLSGGNAKVDLETSRISFQKVTFEGTLTDKPVHRNGKLDGYVLGKFTGEGKITMLAVDYSKLLKDVKANGGNWQDYKPISTNFRADTIGETVYIEVKIPELKFKSAPVEMDTDSDDPLSYEVGYFVTKDVTVNEVGYESTQ